MRGESPVVSVSKSPELDIESDGYSTEGYTSGAYASDEDICGTSQRQESGSDVSTPLRGTTRTDRPIGNMPHPGHAAVPSRGFSEGDYEPLVSMRPHSSHQPAASSPPRKWRKLQSRPGKEMKPAYFKGIQWTKVFVTGPLDPVHNKTKFYCQICKTNVSIYSKGAREIIRHYQSESHLRKDQRWRFEHLGKLDKITGITVHAVRGKMGIFSPHSNSRRKSHNLSLHP